MKSLGFHHLRPLLLCLLLMLLFASGKQAMAQPVAPAHGGTVDIEPAKEFEFIGHGPWSDPNNWRGRRVPQAESNVSVAAQAVARALTIRGNGRVRIDAGGRLTMENNLNLANQGMVEIGRDGQLTVAGSITGAFAKSDPVVTIKSNLKQRGSFIHNTPGIYARVELEVNPEDGNWHMFSAPLSAQLPGNEPLKSGVNTRIFVWYEPLQSWVAYGSRYWQEAHQGREDFIPGRGYMMAINTTKQSEPDIYSFEGSLHTGAFDIPIESKSHPDDAFKGFNLIGNPFHASIDWKAGQGWAGRENLDETSQGGYNMWIWNEELGQYGVQNSASLTDYVHNGVSRYIQPLQAFWVRGASNVQSAHITIDDRTCVHADNEWEKKMAAADVGMVRMQVSSPATPYRDESIIELGHPIAGGGAPKMFSMYSQAPSLYVLSEEKTYSIAFMEAPAISMEIPIGFSAGVSGEYTLQIQGLSQWAVAVELTDFVTGESITGHDQITHVFYANPGDDPGRFVLTMGPDYTTSLPENTLSELNAFLSGGFLQIENPTDDHLSVHVYDMAGKALLYFEVEPFGNAGQAFTRKAGVYILRMRSGTRQKALKLLQERSY